MEDIAMTDTREKNLGADPGSSRKSIPRRPRRSQEASDDQRSGPGKVGKCIISNRKSLNLGSRPSVVAPMLGSRGVVSGPHQDMITSHGPVGCGAYSVGGRRDSTGTTGLDSFGTINFTSDYQEKDIVFGGDKKLLNHRRDGDARSHLRGDHGAVRVPGGADR